MAYQWQLIDNAFFVRWKKLSVADLERIASDLQNARKAQGKPIIYVAIMLADLPVPSAAERQALTDFAAAVKDSLESAHLAMIGDSIKQSIQRTAITAVQWLMQRGSAQFEIHKSLDTVLRTVAPRMNRTPEDLARVLRTRGILDEQIPTA